MTGPRVTGPGHRTELLLVRHGETVWHAENRYAGRSDVALTDHGRAQAADLAARAARLRPDRLLCSTLGRAVDTARPVAAATGLPLRPDPRLVEVDFGRAEGLTRDEMAERFPDALAAFLDRPATSPLPGGETGADAVARATPALAQVCADAGRVLVVAHQTLLRLLLCTALGLPLDRYRDVFPRLDGVAVTTLRVPPSDVPGWPYPAALLGLNAAG